MVFIKEQTVPKSSGGKNTPEKYNSTGVEKNSSQEIAEINTIATEVSARVWVIKFATRKAGVYSVRVKVDIL